ncbi:MAG: tRNA uridine-5-carboxymethylaminomethyl(34) synthesis GTPase MnmE [Bacteroidales bacterium]|nr:tRNA uridine-5-carboxymethylaminomethyl(34) synthesis GTPase MnmE [Bacteroidales bacterium]
MSTIAAISTPSGVGGIAVVRVSGPQALSVVARHVTLPNPQRTTFFSLFRIGEQVLDEVVVTLFHAPHSYTGEDTVEISCHGSLYVQQTLLQTLVDSGARLAEPGEFTRRAFLNGRLDLSQAEAVADLIDSTNAASHSLAISQLRGGYAHELEQLRQHLVELASLLELELDFSEEDVEFADRSHLQGLIARLTAKVEQLVGSFRVGNALKRGIPVAIVGRPNAGKSSLLNALLADDRAIVSPIPGTTRDTIEETMTIDGITFRFIDTAGLRQSDDPIEALGATRAVRAAQQAQIILYVRDISESFDASAQQQVAALTDQCSMQDKHIFIVHNKCDLPHTDPVTGCHVSAKEGKGIDALKHEIANAVRGDMRQSEGVLLTNARHYEALTHLLAALQEVQHGLASNLPADLVVIDLRDALHHLGTITGKVTTDEILGTIFSRFCVGK